MSHRFSSFACLALAALACCLSTAFAGDATGHHHHGPRERAPVRDPAHTFQQFNWSYKELRERNVVMQQYDYSCGAAVVATIMRYYWGDKGITETTILDLMPRLEFTKEELEDRIKNGLTMTDLRNLTREAGYDAAMGRVTFQELSEGKVPVVVGLIVDKHEHFAVYRGTDFRYVYLADPIRGNVRTPVCVFLEQWQKNAILLIAKPGSEALAVNPMGITCEEVQRGAMNDQWINRNALMGWILAR